MTYTTEALPNEPIIIYRIEADFDYSMQGQTSLDEFIKLLDQQTQPVFCISDITHLTLGLDDVVAAANTVTRQMAIHKHPKLREWLIVTQNPIFAMASKGLSSPIFGEARLKVFSTLNEALGYARRA